MSLLDTLLGEVRAIGKWLGLDPARPLPNKVRIAHAPMKIHQTSSLAEGSLLISSDLLQYANHLLRKEAMSLFIPPRADDVPQVHDIAWAYSGAPRTIWERVRVPAPHPFNYDPITMFSVLSRRSRKKVIEGMMLIMRASRTLDLDIYLGALNRFFARELRFTDTDRKVIRELSLNPYATHKYLMERTGVSGASISKSIKKLRRLGYIFGPENVILERIGLKTLVVSFPNIRRYREAFWRFPFTYDQLVPVSREGKVYAYLVFPSSGFNDLLKLSEFGFEIGVVKVTRQRLNCEPPEDAIGAMMRAYLIPRRGEGSVSLSPGKLDLRLSRADLEILNHILREGKVSSSKLAGRGMKSAKHRLSRLREAGLIASYYLLGLPRGMEVTLFKVDAREREVRRLAYTLGAVASSVVHYVESKKPFALALSISPREVKSDLIKGLSFIYGEKLITAQEVFEIPTQWYLPTELWDEEDQVFRWEEPLEKLMVELYK